MLPDQRFLRLLQPGLHLIQGAGRGPWSRAGLHTEIVHLYMWLTLSCPVVWVPRGTNGGVEEPGSPIRAPWASDYPLYFRAGVRVRDEFAQTAP